MKTISSLAACAALSIAFAACGDDDDGAEGTTALTSPDVAVTAAPPGTAAAGDAATSVAGDDTEAADGSAPDGSTVAADPDVAADCEAFESLPALDAEQPAVGDEIGGDYEDQLNEAKDGLEGLDLNTDVAQQARDSLAGFIDEILDSDTWTEELQNAEVPEAWQAFEDACFAATPGG